MDNRDNLYSRYGIEQAPGVGVLGMGEELFRWTLLHNLALLHDHDAVG